MFKWYRSAGLIAALALALATPSVRADDSSAGWEILRTESGIQTSRKAIPGSSFVAFRGEGDVQAPVLNVADVLVDVSHGNQWMDSIKEVRMLRKVSDSDYVLYSHIGTPPIISDREFVYSVHVTMDPDGTQFRIDMRSVDDPLAPHTDYVRGNLSSGIFILRASPDHASTHVIAEMHADPMGNIPGWLMNAFQKNWGYNTLVGLRKQVAAGRSPVHPLLAGHLVSGPSALVPPGPARRPVTVARLAVAALLLAQAVGCGHQKVSPEELVVALTATGVHAESRGVLPPSADWPGAELGVDLVLDYEESYQGVRFASASFARGYCDGAQAAILIGAWCVEPKARAFRPETWNKVNTLRTR